MLFGSEWNREISEILHRLPRTVDDISEVLHRDLKGLAKGVRETRMLLTDADTANSRRLDEIEFDNRKDISDNNKFNVTGYRWPDLPVRGPASRNAPQLIADEFDRMLREGTEAMWANLHYTVRPLRKFEKELQEEGPLGSLNRYYGLNCWEMICYAAARVGVLDKHTLRTLLVPPRPPYGGFAEGTLNSWLTRTWNLFIPGEKTIYAGVGGPPLDRGTLIGWQNEEGGIAHFAMATGRTGGDGSPETYSFYPPPKHELARDAKSGVTDAVQVTTIDKLTHAMAVLYREGDTSSYEVVTGRGPW